MPIHCAASCVMKKKKYPRWDVFAAQLKCTRTCFKTRLTNRKTNRWLKTVPVKTLCVFKYCIKSLYLSINFAGNTTSPRLLSFFTLSLVIFQNRSALKTLKSFVFNASPQKKNMGKNRVTWTIYSVIYTFYSESTKRVVHFFPPLPRSQRNRPANKAR